MTNKYDELTNWLHSKLQETGWSIRQVARQANISHVTIVNFLSGHNRPGPKLCLGLARAFKAPIADVFQMAHLYPLPPEMYDKSEAERHLINYYRSLDERARTTILVLARGLYEQRAEYTTSKKEDGEK